MENWKSELLHIAKSLDILPSTKHPLQHKRRAPAPRQHKQPDNQFVSQTARRSGQAPKTVRIWSMGSDHKPLCRTIVKEPRKPSKYQKLCESTDKLPLPRSARQAIKRMHSGVPANKVYRELNPSAPQAVKVVGGFLGEQQRQFAQNPYIKRSRRF